MSAQAKPQAVKASHAKVEQVTRAQRGENRRRRFLLIGSVAVACVIVAGVIVGVVVNQSSPSRSASGALTQIVPSTPTGAETTQNTPTPMEDTSGISGVLAWDTEGWPGDGAGHTDALEHDHVSGRVCYKVTPPVGGPHSGIWINAGVYTNPVPVERAVHTMEHGAVWITYAPSLSATELKELTGLVRKQSFIAEQEQDSNGQSVTGQANRYINLSPWATDTLPTPIVISAWGHQLRVKAASDPRLQMFIDTFRNSPQYTPEFGAQVDGIPVQTGGRPALDGSKLPNPPGAAEYGSPTERSRGSASETVNWPHWSGASSGVLGSF